MHSIVATSFIGTQESVYRDSVVGNLDLHPLQQLISISSSGYINLLKGGNFPVINFGSKDR